MRLLKNNWFIVAAVFLLVAFFLFDKPEKNQAVPKQEIVLQESNTPLLKEDQEIPVIKVDLKGEVVNPGIYQMKAEQRVDDLIEKAGGLTEGADSNQVNLALKLVDEMVIYVPAEGELPLDANPSVSLQTNSSNSKVNVNTATLEEIMTLNGIGAAKAEAILAYREENGPFATVEDLMEVSGIGAKTIENMKDMILIQ